MSKTNRTKLLLDISTFVAFLVAMDPRTSGIAIHEWLAIALGATVVCLLYTSPSPRDRTRSRIPSSA